MLLWGTYNSGQRNPGRNGDGPGCLQSRDEDVEVFADPAPVGEGKDELLVEAAAVRKLFSLTG